MGNNKGTSELPAPPEILRKAFDRKQTQIQLVPANFPFKILIL